MSKREIKTLSDLAQYFERRTAENAERAEEAGSPELKCYHGGKADSYERAADKVRELEGYLNTLPKGPAPQ